MRGLLRKIACVGLFLSVMFGVSSYKEIIIAFSEPVDINVDYPKDYTNVKAVETQIDMLLDTFAVEESTTTNRLGIVTNKSYSYYYIMPVHVEGEEETYYVGLRASEMQKIIYDRIVQATWSYLNGESVRGYTDFQGGFVEMTEGEYSYFKEWFRDMNYFEGSVELNKYALPLLLKTINYDNMKKLAYGVAIGFAISIFLLLLSFCPEKKNRPVRPKKEVITINGVNYRTYDLEKINKLVEKKQRGKAIKELMAIAKIDENVARDVVFDWYSYWR